MYDTGNPKPKLVLCDNLEEWGGKGGGKGVQGVGPGTGRGLNGPRIQN